MFAHVSENEDGLKFGTIVSKMNELSRS